MQKSGVDFGPRIAQNIHGPLTDDTAYRLVVIVFAVHLAYTFTVIETGTLTYNYTPKRMNV